MADDLLRELLSEGRDTAGSALAFVANQDPEKEKLAKKVMRDITNAMGGVNKWRGCAREDERYYFGWQWPDIDKMRMETQRRPALTFNEIGPKIDAISGIERMNRTEVRFQSRPLDSDVAHDAAGDLATESVATVEDCCDGEMEDSAAIKDATNCGMGWVEIFMDYTVDEDGQVMKSHLDKYEMVWDQKARKANLDDRKWCARVKNHSREDFKKRWPGMLDMIDQSAVFYQEDSVEKYELVTPYYSRQNEQSNPALEAQPTTALANIPVVQYQWIDNIPVWRIADPQNQDQLLTLTEEQWKAMEVKSKLSGTPPPKAVRQLKGVYKQVYVALGVVLEDEVVLPDFTLKAITGQWDSEKKVWYGLVRGLKDPQSTMNKSISSLVAEYITNAKGGVIFKTGTFADSVMAKNQWASYDAWIEANPSADLTNDIRERQSRQVSQFPTMLFDESRQAMGRTSGISDEMVGTATGEQTGPNIDKRVQGGLAILGWLWDNVARYKKSVAHTELEFIREYWSHGQFINVGGDFNSQSIPLLKSDLPIQYNMVLDQSVRYNPNLKNQLWQDLIQIAGPLLKLPAGQTILMKGLKYSNFPTQFVQEVQQGVAEQAQQPPQKGGGKGKQEDPEFTQAKIQKMQAETHRTYAEAAKLGMPEPTPAAPQPQQPKEHPNLTASKIRKMDAETERTMAETRKLDHESHMSLAQLAVDAVSKGHEHNLKTQQHHHKVLNERVKTAQQAQAAQNQQQLAMTKMMQPQPQPTDPTAQPPQPPGGGGEPVQ